MKHNLLKSKRGLIENANSWIIRIFLIMMVVFGVVFFVNSIIKENIEVGELELTLLTARAINSPYCLAKMDRIKEVYRVYPGVIDLSKYSTEYLEENCYIKSLDPKIKDFFGVKIQLNGKEPIYANKEYYEDIEPLSFASRYIKIEKSLPVQVFEKGKYVTSSIEIIAVQKKR